MRLRIKFSLVVVSAIAAATGCEGPREISPVTPPGFDNPRVPAVPEGDGAQALGEQAAAVVSAREAKAKSDSGGSPPTPIGKPTTTATGLTYETLKEGTGPVAKSGQVVTIHYTGTLADGTVFDSSREKDKPFVIPIGIGKVIGGWDEGVPGMKVGERRKLVIPPKLGYGAEGQSPKIPGNATLTFDVELLDAK